MQISHGSDVPLQGQILSKLNVSGFDYVISTEVININRNALVTHTDTDSADATDGPSVSIRSIRNCPYRIRRVRRILVQILKSFKIQARTSKP